MKYWSLVRGVKFNSKWKLEREAEKGSEEGPLSNEGLHSLERNGGER